MRTGKGFENLPCRVWLGKCSGFRVWGLGFAHRRVRVVFCNPTYIFFANLCVAAGSATDPKTSVGYVLFIIILTCTMSCESFADA